MKVSNQSTVIEFDARAGKYLAEMRRLADAQKAMEADIRSASRAAAQGSEEAAKAVERQLVAKFKLQSQSREVARELENIRQKYAANEKAASSWAAGAAEIQTAYKGVSEILSATGILGYMQQALKLEEEWLSKIAERARLQDEIGRKLQVQGLMGDEEFQKRLREQVAPAAMKSAVPLSTAQIVATEMISLGFSKDQAMGPALQEMLMAGKANNSTDLKTFATSVASYLNSQGRELNAEGVRSVGAPIFSLFKDTAIQANDLLEIAKVSALLHNFGFTQQESLASVTALKTKGGMAAGDSATALRNMALILGGAKGNKVTLDMLTAIGGEGFEKEVDMVGETPVQAFGRLKEKMAGFDEPTRQAMLGKLFGRRVSAQALTIFEHLDSVQKYIDLQGDTSQYQEAVKLATGGVAAAKVRQGVAEEVGALDMGGERAELQKQYVDEAQRLEKQAGYWWPRIQFNRQLRNFSQATTGSAASFDMFFSGVGGEGQAGPAYRNVMARVAGQSPDQFATPDAAIMDATAKRKARAAGGRSFDLTKIAEQTVDIVEEEEDARLTAARQAAEAARLKQREANVAARSPDSEGGAEVTRAESRMLQALTQAAEKLDIAADKLKLQLEQEQAKRKAAPIARNAQVE